MYTWLTAVKIAKHWRLLSANICISCQVDTSVYSGASVSANVLLSFGGYARVSHISSSVYTQTNMNTKNIKTLFSSDDSTLYLIQLTEVGFSFVQMRPYYRFTRWHSEMLPWFPSCKQTHCTITKLGKQLLTSTSELNHCCTLAVLESIYGNE